MVEEWLPHLGTTPAVESIFGVEGAVNVLRVDFEVGRDRSRNKFTARGHSHTELKGIGLEEKLLGGCTDSGEG
jgi:hypothetical protein